MLDDDEWGATAVIGVDYKSQALARVPSDHERGILFLGGMLHPYSIVAKAR